MLKSIAKIDHERVGNRRDIDPFLNNLVLDFSVASEGRGGGEETF